MDEKEKKLILYLHNKHDGNVSRMKRETNLSYNLLLRRVREAGLEPLGSTLGLSRKRLELTEGS